MAKVHSNESPGNGDKVLSPYPDLTVSTSLTDKRFLLLRSSHDFIKRGKRITENRLFGKFVSTIYDVRERRILYIMIFALSQEISLGCSDIWSPQIRILRDFQLGVRRFKIHLCYSLFCGELLRSGNLIILFILYSICHESSRMGYVTVNLAAIPSE